MRLILGDCLEKLKDLPDNSVDSIVTDPPYGLSFMGKKWDYDVPSTEIWSECLRVLKPGGHLLSFSGSRTYHRMAVRIEDAGFEIRDQIMWVYGSGFPKSHNIGKAVDKLQGNDREVLDDNPNKIINKADLCIEPLNSLKKEFDLTKGTSEWEGWGTALKPAHEPIVMARKPISEKTVAENVLRWGTGGINIDDSRIGETVETWPSSRSYKSGNVRNRDVENTDAITQETSEAPNGRWPANIIFDEEAGEILDQQSGISKSAVFDSEKYKSVNGFKSGNIYGTATKDLEYSRGFSDKGGASRFFYCPKASKKDRDEGMDGFEEKMSEIAQINSQTKLQPNGEYVENITLPRKNVHPTVKPTELMLYLIKLVTPKGKTVMDCFMGSGSTGKAAVKGGFDFIGIEREEEYYKIAEARINNK